MLKTPMISLAIAFGIAACGTAPRHAEAQTPSSLPFHPTGSAIGPGGFATIINAPPAPFAAVAPKAPSPRPPGQLAEQEQFRKAGEFQARVMDEVQALGERLRRQEADNFVDLYFENEGDPHVVFRFLRNPDQTLARYTRIPDFRAATARYTNAELEAASNWLWQTFQNDRVLLGSGFGNKENRVVAEIGVTEAEFRALAVRKGVTIPETVELRFPAHTPAADLNRPLPATIAPRVRIFPRDNRPVGAINDINSAVTPVLRDGCFRVLGGTHDGALLLFPLGEELFTDRDGYLAFGSEESPGYARVGEPAVFHGSPGEVTAPDLVAPIHEACGPGKVVAVNHLRSAAAVRAQDVVETNARALRDFREMYGLPDPQATRLLEACKKHVGSGVCLLSPPPPVMRQEDCPSGTTLSGGLCRTPDGIVRPLPSWLQGLLEKT